MLAGLRQFFPSDVAFEDMVFDDRRVVEKRGEPWRNVSRSNATENLNRRRTNASREFFVERELQT